MANGGARPGAGRPKGSKNKVSAYQSLAMVLASAPDIMPLDFLLNVMRNPEMPFPFRFEAAKAAAPYCHPKLSVQANTGIGADGQLQEITVIEHQYLSAPPAENDEWDEADPPHSNGVSSSH